MVVLYDLRGQRARFWGGVVFLWLCFMVTTPRIPPSANHHLFADMRNFFGVPNTSNVITNFPFLVVGVVGLVLTLHGNYLGISLRGEIWGWILFYAGITATAFGSAYYHLKPDDTRILWDQLPMMVAVTSLFSCFIIERINEKIGVTCLFSFLIIVLMSVAYES
ncbi:uncharacterized protein [Aristolochia californica]|uniref:uncharacterized protein isoform X2 n=1 Tax=Aristolochia californica TaxID=171875 RepID=UPI0035DFA3E8